MLIKMGENLMRILELQHVTPGNLRGFVRVKLRNIRNGGVSDQKLRSEDTLDRATLEQREMQYLYKDGDAYCFMDTSSYEQVSLSADMLSESIGYITPEMTIQVEFYGSEAVGVELPAAVDLQVLEAGGLVAVDLFPGEALDFVRGEVVQAEEAVEGVGGGVAGWVGFVEDGDDA